MNYPSTFSVVVPVFNSEGSVGEVVERTLAVFAGRGLQVEMILVNDGSTDGSWAIIESWAERDDRIQAVDLLKNYGQHTALLCGLRKSTGDYAVVLDDDLQNPPEEIPRLIRKAQEGHDLVFGQFREKKHALYRRWGSLLVSAINRRIFRKPEGLVASNFKLLHRTVVDRICSHQSIQPYITGLALMYAANPANVAVDHHERPVGSSTYNLVRITRLVMRILFAYSAFPLRMVAVLGMAVSLFAFLLGTFYLLQPFFREVAVPGWTTLVVLLSFFNGITLMMLGMLGEYVVRVLNQTSGSSQYEVRKVAGNSKPS
jgi:glycosyltransferase involved in cell wall biosynthesis